MKSGARIADSGATARGDRSIEGVPLRTGILTLDTSKAALLGAAIVVLIGVPLSALLSIWIDEAFTLHTTGFGALEAWKQAISFEAQPPLYFFLEALFRSLNEGSITVGRLPSVAFAAAAVAAIVFAARRIAPRVPSLVVALVASLNPLVLWAATEMRVYALALLIGAALTWAFYEAFLIPKPDRRAIVWYAVLAIAAMYTQYYFAFVLVAHGITLIAMRRSAVPAFIVTGLIICAGFAPFAGTALMHARASGSFVVHIGLLKAAHVVVDAAFVTMLPHDLGWHGFAKLAVFVAAAALVAVLVVVGRPALPRGPERAIVIQWLVYLALFCLLFAAAGVPLVFPAKYLIAIAPSSLLVALIFVSSLERSATRLGVLALGVYLAFVFVTLATTYRPPFEKPGEWRALGAMLQTDAGATPVAVFPAELLAPLQWYYKGDVIPLPRSMPYTLDYVNRLTLTGEADVARVLDPAGSKAADQLWVVTTGDCGRRVGGIYDYHCGYLESYLGRRYHLVRSVPFNGSLARLYSRLP